MIPKNRVRCLKTGKVLAIEWVDKEGWWFANTESDGTIVKPDYFGTYPHPGVREQFTGKHDKNKVEIYDKGRFHYDDGDIENQYWGTIVWCDEIGQWYCGDGIEPFVEPLYEIEGDIEVA